MANRVAKADGRTPVAVLRFLAGAGGEGGTIEPQTGADGVAAARLARPDGRRLAVTAAILGAMVSRGLVAKEGARIRIQEAGRLALKRLLCGGEAAFADQHRSLSRKRAGDGEILTVNLAESPLGSLARLKRRDGSSWFPPGLIAAGDRLRADFTRGQYLPGMSARMEPVASCGSAARAGGIPDLTDAALAARMRLERALDAVGPELAGLVVDVCCWLKGLETVERERQWPQRSAKLLLHAGLEMLSRHYAPDERERVSRIRKWGNEGYRPDLAADLGSACGRVRGER